MSKGPEVGREKGPEWLQASGEWEVRGLERKVGVRLAEPGEHRREFGC